MLGKTEGKRRRGQKRMRQFNSITNSMDMNLSKLQEIVEDREPGMLQSMRSQRVWPHLGTEQQPKAKRDRYVTNRLYLDHKANHGQEK